MYSDQVGREGGEEDKPQQVKPEPAKKTTALHRLCYMLRGKGRKHPNETKEHNPQQMPDPTMTYSRTT